LEEGKALGLNEDMLNGIKKKQDIHMAHDVNKRRLYLNNLQPMQIERLQQTLSQLSAQFRDSGKTVLPHAQVLAYLHDHGNRVGRFTHLNQCSAGLAGLARIFDWIVVFDSGLSWANNKPTRTRGKLVKFDPPDGLQMSDHVKSIQDKTS